MCHYYSGQLLAVAVATTKKKKTSFRCLRIPFPSLPSHHSFLAASNISVLASLLYCFAVSKSTLSFPSAFVSLFLERELLPLCDGAVAQLMAMPFHQATEDESTLQANALGIIMTWSEKRLWYVRSPLHTLVMCRSKIIRRLTSKDLEPPYKLQVILASLRMVTATGNHFLYGTQQHLCHGKGGHVCHGPLP